MRHWAFARSAKEPPIGWSWSGLRSPIGGGPLAPLLITVAHAAIGDGEHMVRLSRAPRGFFAALKLTPCLHVGHHGQNRCQTASNIGSDSHLVQSSGVISF